MYRTLNYIALALMVLSAVNLGFIGLFGHSLIPALLGGTTVLSRAISVIVGIAGLWGLTLFAPLGREACEQGHRPAVEAVPVTQH